ncbi:hypothetical protein SAV31267_013450 [Streptomyces avermitilis]|uniref:Uncharacterized protein n=1 Tax=Streptomyces avermitilis TaxID=33903 RepID=A0A4D4MIN2_STRAX|nr:hypothetical protein SAV31267_013450 [Streptomyces avermitilis]
MRGLGAVDHEERGDRQEQGEAQTRERVPVDVRARAVRRREEARMGDDLAAVLLDRGRRLEVEQGHRLLVRRDHDVEHVQVVEDDAARVHRVHGLLDRPVDAQRPGRVGGDGVRLGIRREQRVPLGEEGVEGPPLQKVHDEEAVVAECEPVPHLGHHTEPRHLLQRVLLALQAGDRVGPVRGEPRVRPALLEDHLAAVPGVGARVHPAAVGEVQGLLDAVRQVADRRGVARRELRFEERGQRDPLRNLEGGLPPVRHQRPLAVADRRDE